MACRGAALAGWLFEICIAGLSYSPLFFGFDRADRSGWLARVDCTEYMSCTRVSEGVSALLSALSSTYTERERG